MEYIAAFIIFIFLLVHFTILLIRSLRRDKYYNQNIFFHGGKIVGEPSAVKNDEGIMFVDDGNGSTIVNKRLSRRTNSAGHIHLQLQQISTGCVFPYALENQVTIGREGGEAQILLPDPLVSGKHCMIFRYGNQIMLKDLGSTNHTYLNGCRVNSPMPLENGDRIQIGNGMYLCQYHLQS